MSLVSRRDGVPHEGNGGHQRISISDCIYDEKTGQSRQPQGGKSRDFIGAQRGFSDAAAPSAAF